MSAAAETVDAGTPVEHDAPFTGDTIYLTTADGDGNMVSLIQSNYMGFGSGLVVPGLGFALQVRCCYCSRRWTCVENFPMCALLVHVPCPPPPPHTHTPPPPTTTQHSTTHNNTTPPKFRNFTQRAEPWESLQHFERRRSRCVRSTQAAVSHHHPWLCHKGRPSVAVVRGDGGQYAAAGPRADPVQHHW
jgi:hypothetical protein